MTDRSANPLLRLPGQTRDELDALLRCCVQCGLCLPVCATWLETGDETMSPRGRLLLFAEALADPAGLGADPGWKQALDTCIGCRACTAVCPSGVPSRLLETAVEAAREPGPQPFGGGMSAMALVGRLDDPVRLRVLGMLAAAGRRGLRLLLGPRWRARAEGRRAWRPVARMVGALPRAPRGDRELVRRLDALSGVAPTGPGRLPPAAATRERVLWFAGCANEGLLPDASRRLRELLVWAGADLITAPAAGCCGALAAHSGRPGRAQELRERNLAAWGNGRGAAAIITEAAGCGVAVRDYGGRLPLPQRDAVAWLDAAPHPPFGRVPLKVALHDPCHARHGQGLVDEPRRLLRAIPGLVLLEPAEPEACCGSGGLWSLDHAALSAALGARKAALLKATGADLVVTANAGCLGQIADALSCLPGIAPPVLPLGDLLWYAALRSPGDGKDLHERRPQEGAPDRTGSRGP